MSYFRPFFSNFIGFSPYWGLFFILLIGVPRFIIVLGANVSGNYNFTSLIFIFMWILPFLLLNREGRKQIGIRKTKKPVSLLFSFLLGMGICIPVFLLGFGLYGLTTDNWFVYISRSYSGGLPAELGEARFIYFAIFAVISMIFSPIGEELMYRGFIHRCFEDQFGQKRASQIDSAAFALTHLAHFGILYTASGWEFRPIPALLWVLATFSISRFFFYCKQQSGSLLGPILCHSGFNLCMTYFIFYHIL